MILYGNPLIPVFEEKRKEAAAVTVDSEGTYTEAMFRVDYPQFKDDQNSLLIPAGIFATFLDMANDAVSPSSWGKQWRYAVGLYVAHYCAMYLKTYRDFSANAAEAAGNAENVGVVKTATMGDTSVTYDNTAITAGTEKWGTWNATQYGSQLVTLARQLGITGMFVV